MLSRTTMPEPIETPRVPNHVGSVSPWTAHNPLGAIPAALVDGVAPETIESFLFIRYVFPELTHGPILMASRTKIYEQAPELESPENDTFLFVCHVAKSPNEDIALQWAASPDGRAWSQQTTEGLFEVQSRSQAILSISAVSISLRRDLPNKDPNPIYSSYLEDFSRLVPDWQPHDHQAMLEHIIQSIGRIGGFPSFGKTGFHPLDAKLDQYWLNKLEGQLDHKSALQRTVDQITTINGDTLSEPIKHFKHRTADTPEKAIDAHNGFVMAAIGTGPIQDGDAYL